MDTVDRARLLAELTESHCELNHGQDKTKHQAVNFIVLPIGYNQDTVKDVAVRELAIPICIECTRDLCEDAWTLLYCFECGASRWVLRARAKNSYRHHILWLRGCPDCTEVFGGLYFSDALVPTGSKIMVNDLQATA